MAEPKNQVTSLITRCLHLAKNLFTDFNLFDFDKFFAAVEADLSLFTDNKQDFITAVVAQSTDQFLVSFLLTAVVKKLQSCGEAIDSWMNKDQSLLGLLFEVVANSGQNEVAIFVMVTDRERYIHWPDFICLNISRFLWFLDTKHFDVVIKELVQALLKDSVLLNLLASDLFYFLCKFSFTCQTTLDCCCLLFTISKHSNPNFFKVISVLDRILPLLNDDGKKSFVSKFDPLSHARIFKHLNILKHVNLEIPILRMIEESAISLKNDRKMSSHNLMIVAKITSSGRLGSEAFLKELLWLSAGIFLDMQNIKKDDSKEIGKLVNLIEVFDSLLHLIPEELLLLMLRKTGKIVLDCFVDNPLVDFTCIKLLNHLSRYKKHSRFEDEYCLTVSAFLRSLANHKRNYLIKNLALFSLLQFTFRYHKSSIFENCCSDHRIRAAFIRCLNCVE